MAFYLGDTGLESLWEEIKANDVRIATGSYVGTGVIGESNANVLTFDFQPKIVLVTVGRHDAFRKGAMFMHGQEQSTLINSGGTGSSSQGHISLSWIQNGVKWWDDYHNGDGSADWQLNESGIPYFYAAIG